MIYFTYITFKRPRNIDQHKYLLIQPSGCLDTGETVHPCFSTPQNNSIYTFVCQLKNYPIYTSLIYYTTLSTVV